jgi:hypothetical protein
MKKLGLSLVVVSMMFAAPAFAETPIAPAAQGSEAIPLDDDHGHDRLCGEAKQLQESRIRDLRAAVEYDKKIERELLEGAAVRDKDAAIKEKHAKEWREHASRTSSERRKRAFNEFASWLDSEARSDRRFAGERRDAARIIGKGWAEAVEAIKGHEKFLANLREHC